MSVNKSACRLFGIRTHAQICVLGGGCLSPLRALVRTLPPRAGRDLVRDAQTQQEQETPAGQTTARAGTLGEGAIVHGAREQPEPPK